MVEVEVRAARESDYDTLYAIDELGAWPSLCTESAFTDELHEYLVAVVAGKVWGFLQGHNDSDGWAACRVSPAPPAGWTVSFMSHLAVHPQARGYGLGGALLREFMNRSRAADSQWLMMHPAECGANGALPPAMQRLCEHAGLRFVEPLAEHRRHWPTLMATPLLGSPAYHFRAASHVPMPAPAHTHRRRTPTRTRVFAHAA